MKTLNNISSTQYADDVFGKIDENFGDVKSAIDTIEQGGGSSITVNASVPKYKNNPLPLYKDTFKILGLGNSFTLYPTRPLATLLSNAAGFDKTKFAFPFFYRQGYSLANFVEAIQNNTAPLNYYSAGDGSLPVTTSGGLRTVLSQDWDIVVVQQKSTDAKNYSTYEPYLTQLVNLIRTYCTNPRVCIAFQQTWSVNQGNYAAQDAEWTNICNAVKSVIGVNGIDVIIPSGTALQNARHASGFYNSSGNDNHYLLMDGTGHPADGAGRYVCACAWYQALFAPLLGLPPIVGNSATWAASDTSGIASGFDDSLIDVTSENKEILQRAAMAACTDMWNITTIS